jgi:thioredoxin-dependent peroxiredoxin
MPQVGKGIEVGDAAPDWTLRGVDKRNYTLSLLRGRNVLLFFFRGTWCPNCRKQMEQIRERWREISPLADVIGIVGQGEKEVRDFQARNPMPFQLLPDFNRDVIKSYGVYQFIALNGFNIAHPSTLIIDRTGIVQYCYVGGQFDRPDLDKVIRQLQALQAPASR